MRERGFPGSLGNKNPPANAGDTGSTPGRGTWDLPAPETEPESLASPAPTVGSFTASATWKAPETR